MKILALPVSVALIATLASCASSDSPKPSQSPREDFRAIGTIQVPMNLSATLPLQNDEPAVGKPCIPKAGFEDVDRGSQVVILNARGEKVALGKLEAGTLANGPGGDAFIQSVCQFAFAVSGIPVEGSIYSVHIGNESRGEQSFSRTDLQAGVSLSLL